MAILAREMVNNTNTISGDKVRYNLVRGRVSSYHMTDLDQLSSISIQ